MERMYKDILVVKFRTKKRDGSLDVPRKTSLPVCRTSADTTNHHAVNGISIIKGVDISNVNGINGINGITGINGINGININGVDSINGTNLDSTNISHTSRKISAPASVTITASNGFRTAGGRSRISDTPEFFKVTPTPNRLEKNAHIVNHKQELSNCDPFGHSRKEEFHSGIFPGNKINKQRRSKKSSPLPELSNGIVNSNSEPLCSINSTEKHIPPPLLTIVRQSHNNQINGINEINGINGITENHTNDNCLSHHNNKDDNTQQLNTKNHTNDNCLSHHNNEDDNTQQLNTKNHLPSSTIGNLNIPKRKAEAMEDFPKSSGGVATPNTGLTPPGIPPPGVPPPTTVKDLIMMLQSVEPVLVPAVPGYQGTKAVYYRMTGIFCTMNQCYPGLYIGDLEAAMNKDFLSQAGITHVLNTAQGNKKCMVNTTPAYYEDAGVRYLGFQLLDVPTADITQFFEAGADFIEECLSTGGKVLVHCFMGMSRSATIAAAFLMLKRDMSAEAALTTLRRCRPIYPNDGFLLQLVKLEQRIYANRFMNLGDERSETAAAKL